MAGKAHPGRLYLLRDTSGQRQNSAAGNPCQRVVGRMAHLVRKIFTATTSLEKPTL